MVNKEDLIATAKKLYLSEYPEDSNRNIEDEIRRHVKNLIAEEKDLATLKFTAIGGLFSGFESALKQFCFDNSINLKIDKEGWLIPKYRIFIQGKFKHLKYLNDWMRSLQD